MCVVINEFSGFMLFIQSNESGLFQNSYFTTDIYSALQILVWLAFPKHDAQIHHFHALYIAHVITEI